MLMMQWKINLRQLSWLKGAFSVKKIAYSVSTLTVHTHVLVIPLNQVVAVQTLYKSIKQNQTLQLITAVMFILPCYAEYLNPCAFVNFYHNSKQKQQSQQNK